MFGFSLAELHALTVHVPIVLLPLSVLVDVYARARKGAYTAHATSLLLLVLGWLGAGAAVISGWQVQGNARGSAGAETLLFWHRLNGFVIVGLFGLVLALRLGAEYNLITKVRWLPLVLGLAGLGLIVIQGYLGGRMVYRFGVL